MLNLWMIRNTKGQVMGPVTHNRVKSLLDTGKLSQNDELALANHYWFYVREVAEMERFFDIAERLEEEGPELLFEELKSVPGASGGSGSDQEVTMVTDLNKLRSQLNAGNSSDESLVDATDPNIKINTPDPEPPPLPPSGSDENMLVRENESSTASSKMSAPPEMTESSGSDEIPNPQTSTRILKTGEKGGTVIKEGLHEQRPLQVNVQPKQMSTVSSRGNKRKREKDKFGSEITVIHILCMFLALGVVSVIFYLFLRFFPIYAGQLKAVSKILGF